MRMQVFCRTKLATSCGHSSVSWSSKIEYGIQWSLYFTALYFKTTLIIRPPNLVSKCYFLCTTDLYFKTNCNVRPHFHGAKFIGGLKIEAPLLWNRSEEWLKQLSYKNCIVLKDQSVLLRFRNHTSGITHYTGISIIVYKCNVQGKLLTINQSWKQERNQRRMQKGALSREWLL